MGVSGKFGTLALLMAICAWIIGNLEDGPKYEVMSRLLYPLFRALFASGLAAQVMFRNIDSHSNFTLPGDLHDPEWLEQIRAWKPGDQDVIMATFPKSGTHFMMQLLLQIVSNASDATADFECIHDFETALEILRPSTFEKAKISPENTLFLTNYKDKSPVKPFLHTTHLDFEHLPASSTAKYIVMIRDPLDVMRSLHSQIGKFLGRLQPSLDEVLPIFLRGMGGWAEYHRGWWTQRHKPNILILFYADAVKNLSDAVYQITDFLGRETDLDTVARVVERSSIDYMKKRSKSFEPPALPKVFPFQKPQGTDVGMINKGKMGEGKAVFSASVQAAVREYCRRVLADIDFPFDSLPSCQ
eukprot:TRINITY_DN69111_c0_g1_i1.p1 TRINITY_DN69111_c0_g1~~TRINITY_DN69111_c0_g1_i1.p1  ORF type:complete len:357 (-),score=46.80 TRINITY_DN69111_c0_g1_i1:32-1102(-)